MILAQLELNEAAEVEFGIEIHGTSEKTSDIRFIIEGPTYGIVCKCREDNGVITASIPKLKGILPAGQFEAKLEVVLDGKYFKPLHESIEFKPLVEFDVTSTKARPTVETKVSTTAIKVRVMEKEEPVKDNVESEKDDTETCDEEVETKLDDSKVESPVESKPVKATVTKSSEEKAPSSGNSPVETWDQIVKRSITRPDNAPKIEKGSFDYDNVSKASAIKPTSNNTKSSVKSSAIASSSQTSTTTVSTNTKSESKPIITKPVEQTSGKGDHAKQLLDKISGFKSRLATIKSNKAK